MSSGQKANMANKRMNKESNSHAASKNPGAKGGSAPRKQNQLNKGNLNNLVKIINETSHINNVPLKFGTFPATSYVEEKDDCFTPVISDSNSVATTSTGSATSRSTEERDIESGEPISRRPKIACVHYYRGFIHDMFPLLPLIIGCWIGTFLGQILFHDFGIGSWDKDYMICIWYSYFFCSAMLLYILGVLLAERFCFMTRTGPKIPTIQDTLDLHSHSTYELVWHESIVSTFRNMNRHTGIDLSALSPSENDYLERWTLENRYTHFRLVTVDQGLFISLINKYAGAVTNHTLLDNMRSFVGNDLTMTNVIPPHERELTVSVAFQWLSRTRFALDHAVEIKGERVVRFDFN